MQSENYLVNHNKFVHLSLLEFPKTTLRGPVQRQAAALVISLARFVARTWIVIITKYQLISKILELVQLNDCELD